MPTQKFKQLLIAHIAMHVIKQNYNDVEQSKVFQKDSVLYAFFFYKTNLPYHVPSQNYDWGEGSVTEIMDWALVLKRAA